MSSELIEVLILAAVAVVVIGRFFSVLGQRRGSDRPEAPQQAPVTVDAGVSPQPFPAKPPVTAPATASVGVASILAVDPAFDPQPLSRAPGRLMNSSSPPSPPAIARL